METSSPSLFPHTFMDLKISEHNTCCLATQKRIRSSRSNKQTSWGAGDLQNSPLLPACQSCWSPPSDPGPGPPQALLLEQSPHCVRLLSPTDNIRLPSTQAAIEGFWAGSMGARGGGGLGVYRGRNDGWAVCGNRAPARLSTCERGQCSANLQFRSPPSERERLAQSRPPLMANVIPILILDPYFSPNSLFLCQKRKKSEKRTTSAHLEGFSSIPTLPLQPH